MWQIKILTFFPEIYPGQLALSVTGKAMRQGLWEIEAKSIKDFALDKHKTVDDYVYGGGSGMLLKPDVLGYAIDTFFIPNKFPIFYLSPRGKVFDQNIASELIEFEGINIICGRFEGIDERILLEYKITELSLGDFVLSSGDIASIPVLDTCIRLLPEVMEDAVKEESFGLNSEYRNLLEYPQYTKPAIWRNHEVPEVLKSGNHVKINKWRLEQAIDKTRNVRPDLLDRFIKGENR